MASTAILAGTAILFLGATAILVAPLEEFVDAGLKQRFNKGGRVLGYVCALIAYMGALSELGSSETAVALVTVVRRRVPASDPGIRQGQAPLSAP